MTDTLGLFNARFSVKSGPSGSLELGMVIKHQYPNFDHTVLVNRDDKLLDISVGINDFPQLAHFPKIWIRGVDPEYNHLLAELSANDLARNRITRTLDCEFIAEIIEKILIGSARTLTSTITKNILKKEDIILLANKKSRLDLVVGTEISSDNMPSPDRMPLGDFIERGYIPVSFDAILPLVEIEANISQSLTLSLNQ